MRAADDHMRPDVRLASRLGPPGSAADDAANGGRGAIELRAKASYLDVIDALFVQHATASGYTTFIGSSWTSGCDPVEAGFDALLLAPDKRSGGGS